MSSITLHAATLYLGAPWFEAAGQLAARIGADAVNDAAIRDILLERAAVYEPTQPSYAADLRAAAGAV